MRLRTLVLGLSILMFTVHSIHGQYKEMSKIESLSKSMPEPEMFNGMAAHFGVTADTLKQEKAANGLSFGQLYLAHAIAKVTKSDPGAILVESKGKLWTEITKEKKVDMKLLADDADVLEKAIKKLQKSK
jgi:hypothetical protein